MATSSHDFMSVSAVLVDQQLVEAGNPTIVAEDETTNSPQQVREVHKAGWLKRILTVEKKVVTSPFTKLQKVDKLWVAFCIHDDSEPWLEFYESRRFAFSHKPPNSISLWRCKHIAPCIVMNDEEFVFTVVMAADVVRLAAPTKDLMMDWITTLQNKLREMNILEPKDNIYSREPELKPSLAPNRDPNSPLPVPPGIARLLPGTMAVNRLPLTVRNPEVNSSSDQHDNAIVHSPSTPSGFITGIPAATYMRNPPPLVTLPPPYSGQRDRSISPSYRRHSQPVSPTGGCQLRSTRRGPNPSTIDRGPLSAPPYVNVPFHRNTIHFTFDEVNAPQLCPGVSDSLGLAAIGGANLAKNMAAKSMSDVTSDQDRRTASITSNQRHPSTRMPNLPESLTHRLMHQRQSASVTHQGSSESNFPMLSALRDEQLQNHSPPVHIRTGSDSGRLQRSAWRSVDYAVTQAITGRIVDCRSVGDAANSSRSAEQPNSSRGDNYEFVSNFSTSPALPPPRHARSVSQPVEDTKTSFGFVLSRGQNASTISLKESQVLQLRREIAHAGGVRVKLRKQSCINTIALVDVFTAVHVAGWKQREQPILYNTFHIGDRVLAINGADVSVSADVHRIISMAADGSELEFIIARVPRAQVYAIRREYEGQDLGIARDGGTNQITEVLSDGLAARHGLKSRATTTDGHSLCNWVLTEINNRPLNLFFKDNEAHDRLNAVGKDISILVQPSDFIKSMKKQLKLIKNYKDFLVQ